MLRAASQKEYLYRRDMTDGATLIHFRHLATSKATHRAFIPGSEQADW